MEDGKYWELVRHYKDFYALQCSLMEAFPEVSGKVEGVRRTLPLMPGPLPWVTERITSERRVHLDTYLRTLLTVSPDITSSQYVRAFFTPRDGDREMESDSDTDGFRLSAASQQSSQLITPQSSSGNLSAVNGTANSQRHSGPGSHPYNQNQVPGGYQNTSDLRVPNGTAPSSLARPNPSFQGQSLNSAASSASLANSAGPAPTTTKIKVWFADANCVVIRMASIFTFTDLVAKLRDRWALEQGAEAAQRQFTIEYKDEVTSMYWRMTSDQDLAMARERNDKLTLRIGLAEEAI